MARKLKKKISGFFLFFAYNVNNKFYKCRIKNTSKFENILLISKKFHNKKKFTSLVNQTPKKKETLLFNINFFSKYGAKTNDFFGKLNLFFKKIRFYNLIFFLKNFSNLFIRISKKCNKPNYLLFYLIHKKFFPLFTFKLIDNKPTKKKDFIFICTLDRMILKLFIKLGNFKVR
jgi:hypothetical protein